MASLEGGEQEEKRGEAFVNVLDFDDAPALLQLSQEEGWPHTLRDWRAILTNGTVGGYKCNGQLLSSVSLTEHTPAFASIGMMLVAKQFRRQGLATNIMKILLESQAPNKSLGMIATRETIPFCERLGFHRTGEHVLKMVKPAHVDAKKLWGKDQKTTGLPIGADAETRDRALTYDSFVAELFRDKLIEYALDHSDRAMWLPATEAEGSFMGFGCANLQAANLLTVGPIVTTDPEAAMDMAMSLTLDHDGPSRIDVYEVRYPDIKAKLKALGHPIGPPRELYYVHQAFIDMLKKVGYVVEARQPVMMYGGQLQRIPGHHRNSFCPINQAWT